MVEQLIHFDIIKRYSGFSLECEASFGPGITAVFGPSGSGKTTLLNCLAGLVSPDEGTIEFMGETVYSSADRKRVAPEKRRFGYVFQDSALFPHMNVWENIRYGYKLTPSHKRRTEPEELVELLQLSDLLDRSVGGLSGGERQRVALARALATSPNLLLLDEPLGSLDAAFRGLIIRYLKRIWRDLRTSMVYVTHSMSEVMALGESMLVLSGGKAVAQGRPSQVLVRHGLGTLAEYATLENLLEAEVVTRSEGNGTAEIKLGHVRLTTVDTRSEPGEVVTVSIRASDIILALGVPTKISAQNIIQGTVEETHTLVARVLVYVDVGSRLVVEITPQALGDLGLRPGLKVFLIIKSTSILVLDSLGSA